MHFYSHTPRGVRQNGAPDKGVWNHFYSHTPRGVRRLPVAAYGFCHLFLLPPPSRGATGRAPDIGRPENHFYSHTPRGVRLHVRICVALSHYFYSHTPRGVRRFSEFDVDPLINFYSHTPRGVRPSVFCGLGSCVPFLLPHPSRGATLKLGGLA